MSGKRKSDDQALYVISVAAELAGLHPQTLRMYERKGLIEPERTSGRSRRYSESDVALLERIQQLTNEGLNLAGVQRVLALEDQLARTRARIEALEREVDETRRLAVEQVEEVHRSYRRDLVPVSRNRLPIRRGSGRRSR
ncbi:MAG: MerR family transcriptional regulator [Acidimicrobiia bacterium]|nr:MerR family transcriptional regulator [Acidimicrobiia bacterium]